MHVKGKRDSGAMQRLRTFSSFLTMALSFLDKGISFQYCLGRGKAYVPERRNNRKMDRNMAWGLCFECVP